MAQGKKHIVWFGMKVSPQEKEKIKKLARVRGTSQKEAVMNLVESELVAYEAENTAQKNKLTRYAGVLEGKEDLSVNKTYLAGYGQDHSR